MPRYTAYNAAMPTTAAIVKVTTGTAIKTMLQIATPASRQIQIVEWGVSLDDPPGADSIVELLQTDVAATVTAHVAAGLYLQDPNGTASLMTLGTTATGYTSSGEGTPTATRFFGEMMFDTAAGTTDLNRVLRWPDGQGPIVAVSKFLRVRATFATTASDMLTYVTWDE